MNNLLFTCILPFIGLFILILSVVWLFAWRKQTIRNMEDAEFLKALIDSCHLTKTAYLNIGAAFEDCSAKFKKTFEYKRLWTEYQTKYQQFSPYVQKGELN